MRSVPNRKALFDLSIAGPLAGFVVTLPLLIWGLAHSTVVCPARDVKPDALNPNYSFLVALLSKLVLGTQLTGKAIDLHPVAVAGFLGLVVTALNLMPVDNLMEDILSMRCSGNELYSDWSNRSILAVGLSLFSLDFLVWAFILFLCQLPMNPP